jgi:hypothetical protein
LIRLWVSHLDVERYTPHMVFVSEVWKVRYGAVDRRPYLSFSIKGAE